MSRSLTALVVLVASLQAGCYTLRADVPGALRADLDDEQIVVTERFEREHAQLYLLYGLVGAAEEDVFSRSLEQAADEAGADGAANVVFRAWFSPSDVLISTISFGLVVSRTYRLEADLVQIRAPPLPGTRRRPGAARAEEVAP